MTRIIPAFLVAAVLAVAATSAHAQQWTPYSGWYGTGSVGWYQLRDRDGSASNGTDVHAEYDPGYALGVAAGYGFGNGFRAELEGSYAHANSKNVRIGSFPASGGDTDIWAIYGAGYYDFDTGINNFRPYLGGGVGWAHTDADAITVGGLRGGGGTNDDWSAFAEGGLNFALNDRLDLVPGVRYTWYNDSKGGLDDNRAWLFKATLRYKF
jgi:opacity protein-like surface antigen